MRKYLLILFITLFSTPALAGSGTVFYVCAHPDDCVLFMNPNLYNDITQDADKTVIIYLTSGDAGEAFSDDEKSYPYARELAAVEATEWMADIGEDSVKSERKTETVEAHGHAVERSEYANTVSYFLRLPDGDMEGTGFERYEQQSLKKLKNGDIAELNPVDGEAAYNGWEDLLGVLSNIFRREAAGAENIAVHVQEPDATLNHNDHSDHAAGGSAMIALLEQNIAEDKTSCYLLYKHLDYSIAGMAENLNATDLQNKSGSFAVISAALSRIFGAHHWDKAHLAYLARNYYSTVTIPIGCGK